MKETRAIVTGFEPFGPYLFNPTADLAMQLDHQLVANTRISGIVLPATYDTSYQMLLEACRQICPQVVLSLGVFSNIPRIRVEACGRNEMSGKYADKLGVTACGEKIDLLGPDILNVNVDTTAIQLALTSAGIPTDISFNADTFVCNALIYRMMMAINAGLIETLFVFIHTPWAECYRDKIPAEKAHVTIPWNVLQDVVHIVLSQTFPMLC